MAEGEKAFNEAKSTFDNPLAEPESAPQIAAEPQPAVAESAPIASEPLAEPAPAPMAESSPASQEEKPAKAAAAG
jgi:sec-independent protein translocase protein TatB